MTSLPQPLRVPSIARLSDVLEQLGYVYRDAATGRCDVLRGSLVELRNVTAADVYGWLRQRGEIE